MITKLGIFVIVAILTGFNLIACGNAENSASKKGNSIADGFDEPKVVGRISSEYISESSGLVFSKCNNGVLWTHNDSGNSNEIFALNTEGKFLGRWQVTNSTNIDWEDIATKKTGEKCFLLIGDFGGNAAPRNDFVIFKVAEPKVSPADAKQGTLSRTEPASKLVFKYPDKNQDAEALVVNPNTNALYIITKNLNDSAVVYKITGEKPFETAEKLYAINLPALPKGSVTGGDVAPDGKHLVLTDYFLAYEYVLPERENDFEKIFTQSPNPIEIGERKQGEAIAYSLNGNSILVTSEGHNSPLIRVDRH
ncbi:MAG: hypothetical protein ACK5NT_14490 [Pyrinomonadaceae bacterium]